MVMYCYLLKNYSLFANNRYNLKINQTLTGTALYIDLQTRIVCFNSNPPVFIDNYLFLA